MEYRSDSNTIKNDGYGVIQYAKGFCVVVIAITLYNITSAPYMTIFSIYAVVKHRSGLECVNTLYGLARETLCHMKIVFQ